MCNLNVTDLHKTMKINNTDNLALSMAECYKKLRQWEKDSSSQDINDGLAFLYSSQLSENITTKKD